MFEMSDEGRGHFATMLYFMLGYRDPDEDAISTICNVIPQEGEEYRHGICLYCESPTVVLKDEQSGGVPRMS